jgi:hypothetical protein
MEWTCAGNRGVRNCYVAQMLGRHIFPFPFAKRHDRNLFLSRERIHRCYEALADRVHQRAGHKPITAMR